MHWCHNTGWSVGTDKKYWSIAQARKYPWAYYHGGKVHWCSYILIFHGHNQYKWFSILLFHSASISLEIKVSQKIHTKSFEILCKKSILLSFLVILSLGLKIEHSEWNFNEFFITLKQPVSEMLGKITFFLLIWNLINFMGSTRIKDKKWVWLMKSHFFQHFWHGLL